MPKVKRVAKRSRMEKGKFTKFGLTVHPKGGQGVNWKQLTKEEVSEKLNELEFVKPRELARVLLDTRIFKESRKNKHTGESQNYYSETENLGGQLELGDQNGTPHYQCWIELTSKNTASKVLKYFSQILYQEDKSSAVSVRVLTEDISDYIEYCKKEKRADLPGDFRHINIDKMIGELDKYLEENPDAKKSLKTLMAIKGI